MGQKTETEQDLMQPQKPVAIMSVGEETAAFANLSASLTEIRKLKDVKGYILRSDTSAIIDLNEQDRITQYAILTSEIHKSTAQVSKQLRLGAIESVLVEGKDLKVLYMSIDENEIDILMEKTAAHSWIIKRIRL